MGLNPRLARIPPSLIRQIADKRKPSSIDLGLGEPSLKPSMEYFRRAQNWIERNGCPYTQNAGDAELRKLIAEHYALPELTESRNVCITNGSQEAIFSAISALLDPAHDELLVVEPVFASYAKVAEFCGVTTRAVGMDPVAHFAFNAERILEAIDAKTRMIALCSPCNPTGRVLSQAEAEVLAAGLLARPGEPIIVLFDQVYRELTYTEPPCDFARLYPHTVTINALSKSNALTGLRLGWALGPSSSIEPIVRAHAWATSVASTYAQRVAVEIFLAKALSEHHSWYAQRARDVGALLDTYHLRATPIEGSFYSFLCIAGAEDSLAAALCLAEDDDVLVIPGLAFGHAGEGWLRLSFVGPLTSVEEGLIRLRARFS